MTVDELIVELEQMRANGHGKTEVRSWSGSELSPIDPPSLSYMLKRSRSQLWWNGMDEQTKGRQIVML